MTKFQMIMKSLRQRAEPITYAASVVALIIAAGFLGLVIFYGLFLLTEAMARDIYEFGGFADSQARQAFSETLALVGLVLGLIFGIIQWLRFRREDEYWKQQREMDPVDPRP